MREMCETLSDILEVKGYKTLTAFNGYRAEDIDDLVDNIVKAGSTQMQEIPEIELCGSDLR